MGCEGIAGDFISRLKDYCISIGYILNIHAYISYSTGTFLFCSHQITRHKKVSHVRSASLPINQLSSLADMGRRKSSSQDVWALAPPFTSPKSESILGPSVEHVLPYNIGQFIVCTCIWQSVSSSGELPWPGRGGLGSTRQCSAVMSVPVTDAGVVSFKRCLCRPPV